MRTAKDLDALIRAHPKMHDAKFTAPLLTGLSLVVKYSDGNVTDFLEAPFYDAEGQLRTVKISMMALHLSEIAKVAQCVNDAVDLAFKEQAND